MKGIKRKNSETTNDASACAGSCGLMQRLSKLLCPRHTKGQAKISRLYNILCYHSVHTLVFASRKIFKDFIFHVVDFASISNRICTKDRLYIVLIVYGCNRIPQHTMTTKWWQINQCWMFSKSHNGKQQECISLTEIDGCNILSMRASTELQTLVRSSLAVSKPAGRH